MKVIVIIPAAGLGTRMAPMPSAMDAKAKKPHPSKQFTDLAGTPILIWADGQWRLDNCERWNVFLVPTYIVANDTHRPEPERVGQKSTAARADLRQRTDDFRQPSYTLPK